MSSRGTQISYLLILFLVLITLLPEDAEARRRGGRRFRRGAAMRVNAQRRPPQQRRQGGQGRQVQAQAQGNFAGLGRRLDEGSFRVNRFNNGGLAFDENRILDGSFDGNGFNNDIQQVVLNGRALLVARDRNGQLFPLSENFVDRQGRLVVDPTTAVSGTAPLVRLRNGQVLRVDSRGNAISGAVARDLSFMGEGGLIR